MNHYRGSWYNRNNRWWHGNKIRIMGSEILEGIIGKIKSIIGSGLTSDTTPSMELAFYPWQRNAHRLWRAIMFQGQTFFDVVDSHSKRPEVVVIWRRIQQKPWYVNCADCSHVMTCLSKYSIIMMMVHSLCLKNSKLSLKAMGSSISIVLHTILRQMVLWNRVKNGLHLLTHLTHWPTEQSGCDPHMTHLWPTCWSFLF